MTDEKARPRAADDYEASNMAGAGEVLHRDKLVSRPLAIVCLLMMLFAFLGAAGGLAQGAPLAAGLGVGAVGLLFLFLGLTRTVLRTVVTADDIRVHWGLWGPRIPLSAVKSVSVRRDYSRQALTEAMREPGAPGVEMFAIPHRGELVDLEWTDESGRPRRAWLGAGDPVALCDAIQRAAAAATGRARIAGATSAVRVAEAVYDQAAYADTEEEVGPPEESSAADAAAPKVRERG